MNTPILPPTERGARAGGEVSQRPALGPQAPGSHTLTEMQPSLPSKDGDARAAHTISQPDGGELTIWHGARVKGISSL